MTRILVTGGNGYIGQHLVSALVARGRQLRVLDLRAPSRPLPDVQYLKGSVLDADVVDEAMAGVDQVYHLAGLPGMWMPDKADFHAVNCGGTEVVMAAARKLGIARLNRFFSPHRARKTRLRKIAQ
jgi:dihydroflavonol-4-reductase